LRQEHLQVVSPIDLRFFQFVLKHLGGPQIGPSLSLRDLAMTVTTKLKTRLLKVRVAPDLAHEIERIARERDVSQSALVRQWAEAEIKNQYLAQAA
jgi:hypothetical protein